VDIPAIKKAIIDLVEERKTELTAIAEELYRSPETALEEYNSMSLLTGFLEREGFLLERVLPDFPPLFVHHSAKGVLPSPSWQRWMPSPGSGMPVGIT
jgi:metal-dependent amidase/aminoacylase/carboxypeptidase family protein